MKYKIQNFKYLLLSLFFLFFSCSEISNENPETLFGLPHIAIEIRESDYTKLLKDALVNEYAAITIEHDGVKKTGKIRRRGNVSRYFPKPSFNLEFDDEEWHLVASNIDKSYCREVFGYEIFKAWRDFSVPKTEFIALSVNNIYQGLYILREPIDEKFFERRNIVINSLYEVKNGGKFTFKDGHNSTMDFEKHFPKTSVNYGDLNVLISALDENDDFIISNIVSINNIAKYSFMSSAINHYDGITKNLYIANTKPDNKFQLIPYDLDLTFGMRADESFVIPQKTPIFKNGLLEQAEEIFLNSFREVNRKNAVNAAKQYINSNLRILDNLKNEISQAYENDPYLQDENLDEHIAKIKEYVVKTLK